MQEQVKRTIRAQEIASAYEKADDKARGLVQFALAEYLEKETGRCIDFKTARRKLWK